MECRLRVGLLDADIYGPSVPKLMKLDGQPGLDSGSILMRSKDIGSIFLWCRVEDLLSQLTLFCFSRFQ